MSALIHIDEESFAQAMGVGGLAELHNELRFGVHAKAVQAHFRQRAHAKRAEGSAPIEEIGGMEMVVDAQVYHLWGQELGYECWDDPEFCREFRRDNPDVRVKGSPRKTTILMPGDRGWAA